jgi:hypothetical protein
MKPRTTRKRKYLVVYQDMRGQILSRTVLASSRDQADAIVRVGADINHVYGARPPKNEWLRGSGLSHPSRMTLLFAGSTP